jgi:small subunit ribosomal protein S17
VTVEVEWRRAHSLYKKSMRRRKRFKAHDSENKCKVGDRVRIVETRPISKTKRWRVVEILPSEKIVEVLPEDIETVDSPNSLVESVSEDSEAGNEDRAPAIEAAVDAEEKD